MGLAYYVPIIICWEWFPNKKGAIAGGLVSGFGFGPVIFGFFTSSIVNPNNVGKLTNEDGKKIYFPQEVSDRVPEMYHKSLILMAALSVAGVLLISRNPAYVVVEPPKKKTEEAGHVVGQDSQRSVSE